MSCNPNARYFIGDESQKPRYQAWIGYKAAAPNAYRLAAPNYAAKINIYNSARASFYNSPSYASAARGMPVYKAATDIVREKEQPASPTTLANILPAGFAKYGQWVYSPKQQQQQQAYVTPPASFSDLQERLAEMAFAPKKRRRMQLEADYDVYQPTTWWTAERTAA
ncbi:MAG: hypothetical protein HY438_01735 [DPANN group archaeon]|nr:hypothetical protein [DPANN group archaeon]